jgi:ATP-dependent Lon protease
MIPIEEQDHFDIPDKLCVVPVRDLVVFPYTIVPLFVSRKMSIAAIEQAMTSNRLILLATQKEESKDKPILDDLYRMGTAGMIMRMRRMTDGRLKVLVQGMARTRLDSFIHTRPHLMADVSPIFELPLEELSVETEALMRSLQEKLHEYSTVSNIIGPDVLVVLQSLKDPGRLADLAASNIPLEVEKAQKILSSPDPVRRLRIVADILNHELELAIAKARIENQTKEKMVKTQREYFLREQMKEIRSELGDEADQEIDEFEDKIHKSDMPEEIKKEALKQLKRLSKMHTESAEAGTIRTYIEWLLDLSWKQATKDKMDLEKVKEVLDLDHLGLEKPKDRVLEFLSVRKLNPKNPGPIQLLVGPPGVGKTSFGRAIAKALGRKFVRISLGGVRDDAEIRGHRRTYVGAMPGRIIQAMKQAGSINPVIVLDEVDKLGSDFRGDPSAALLEVLDPEVNDSFVDHYLGVPYNLSQVMFITTANRQDTIPRPLLDRMEEINLSGYSLEDKVAIAQKHLVPRQRKLCGLNNINFEIKTPVIKQLIEKHTREAGLRQLERAIAQICRKIARQVAVSDNKSFKISQKDLATYLGPPVHLSMEQLPEDSVGIVNGLAWTPTGGEIIQVEVAVLSGRGQLILTGQLGDVMKESAHAALSYTRSKAELLGLAPDYFANHDIHIHVPAASIPKDGPSAGITMAVGMISYMSSIAVRHKVAMTGEISLRGRLLPVGGLREKILAAQREGLTDIITPALNRGDIDSFRSEIEGEINFHQFGSIDEVLDIALCRLPWKKKPLKANGKASKTNKETKKKRVLNQPRA